jgi:hypothetical protein
LGYAAYKDEVRERYLKRQLNDTPISKIVPSPQISVFKSFSQYDFEQVGGEDSDSGVSGEFCNKQHNCQNALKFGHSTQYTKRVL